LERNDFLYSGKKGRTVQTRKMGLHQLSALLVLANYGRGHNENVTIPYAAGCQTVGIYPYKESESDPPRAMAGLTDLSARFYICKQLGDNLMTFAVPLKKVVNNDCFL
jgi:hypothetical protein